MILLEAGELSLHHENFHLDDAIGEHQIDLDLLQEVRELDHIKEVAVKQRATRKYNNKILARHFM